MTSSPNLPFLAILHPERTAPSWFPLTKSRVLVVGRPVPSAAGRVVASGVERVVAVVRQVASVSVPTGTSAGGGAVTHTNLTELVVDLEPLHVELLHLLHSTTETPMLDGKSVTQHI